MRLLVLAACLSASSLGIAADDPVVIDHWGNMLMVTAPSGPGDPAMANRMGEKITVEFQDTPISEVVDFLRKVSSSNFVCDPTVIASNKTVTLKADKMELRNVLSFVTSLTHIHAGFLHGAVYLSEKPIVGESRTVLYDVSDLVMPIKDFAGPELAFNASSGAGGIGCVFKTVEEDDHRTTTIDDLAELVRKHATH
ncbi:MAG: hypothetical protein H0W83_14140 [Planctomycetes bacterium]|nr:hypothetical protein [Planctomycetota bacterium]